MSKKHFFNHRTRKKIRKLLESGIDPDDIPSALPEAMPPCHPCLLSDLPDSVQAEIRVLEAKCHLKKMPDVNGVERRLVLDWIRAGHREDETFWVCEDREDEFAMNFLESIRYMNSRHYNDPLPHLYLDHDPEDELPF